MCVEMLLTITVPNRISNNGFINGTCWAKVTVLYFFVTVTVTVGPAVTCFPYTVQPQPAALSLFFRTTKQAEVMKVLTSIRVSRR